MAFLENRYYWHTEKKSPDVFRIVCLGDSLTFGCGVAPHNTLPSQLATLLNRSLWEPVIEVVNAGICGFSLYDEWNFYCHHVNRFNPDLLLIILCPNDAELFSVQRNYEDHVKACWDERGNHLPYFRKAIARVGKQVTALGLPCLIAFYDISGEQDAEKYASVTKGICDENGLSFISLAAEFTGEYSGRNNPGMNVSSVDRHPSGLAHQVAAQRLARHLTHNNLIPAGGARVREEELYRTVIRVGTFLNDNGLQPELCISRMREILETKRGGRARAALDPALLMEEREFSQLESSLAAAMENSVMAVFLAGFAERLKWNSSQYYQDMEGIQRFWVRDDDTIMSSSKDTTILVRLAPPVLWGDTTGIPFDTTFVVINNGAGVSYNLRIHAFDTNGVNFKPVRYYWSEESSFDSTSVNTVKTNDTTRPRTIGALEINHGWTSWIYARDDDGLVRGRQFTIFADSAPPAPTFFNQGTSTDSVVFKWEKKQDAHDGLKTKLQIYISQGTTSTPSTPLFSGTLPTLDDPRIGSETVGGIPCFTYKFKCSFSGAGRWSVMLQDARGSQSLGNPSISSFVAP